VEAAGYEQLIAQFEAVNSDVDVVFAPVPEQDDLLARLTTGFAAGDPPDVFLINYRNYGQFAEAGVLEPVQSFLDASAVIAEDEFAETSMEAFRYDGATLTCMPQNVSSLVVYYNADMFEQANLELPAEGWTWDDFLAAAQALTQGDTYGLGTDADLIRLAPFVWSNGGDIVDDPDNPTTLTLDQGPAREALDFFLDLQLVHGVVPPDVEEQSMGSEDRFIAGKLGMYLNSRRVVPGLRAIQGFTWDVAPLPVAPGGEPTTILHGDAYCMAKDGNTQAAWRLIEFANSADGQTILAQSGRTVPSRTDVAESDPFLAPDQPPASSRVFIDVIPIIRPVPVTATWRRVEKAADSVIEEMFYGRIDREAGVQQLINSTKPLFGASG
jgi:multiple sugar transport system substrate-binding protein